MVLLVTKEIVMETFPVGGPRQDVYDYLQSRGFVMSSWSDKSWTRADGFKAQIYGSGSCASVTRSGAVIAEGPLKETIESLG